MASARYQTGKNCRGDVPRMCPIPMATLKEILKKAPGSPTAQEAILEWYTKPDQEQYTQLWREIELPKLLHATPEQYARYCKEGIHR